MHIIYREFEVATHDMNIYKLKIFKTKDIGVEINSMLGGDDLLILNMIFRQINDNRTNILCNLY